MWGAIIGALGSLWSGYEQKRAADRAAAAMQYGVNKGAQTLMALGRPLAEAGKYALGGLQGLAGYYGGMLGKPSQRIAAEHTAGTAEAERMGRRSETEAGRYWGGRGDMGRASGEITRARERSIYQRNLGNIGYAASQEEYVDRNANRYAGVMGGISDLSRLGMGMMTAGVETGMRGTQAAALTRLQGQQDFYNDLGSLFGLPIGMYLSKQQAGLEREAAGGTNTPNTTSAAGVPSQPSAGTNWLSPGLAVAGVAPPGQTLMQSGKDGNQLTWLDPNKYKLKPRY